MKLIPILFQSIRKLKLNSIKKVLPDPKLGKDFGIKNIFDTDFLFIKKNN